MTTQEQQEKRYDPRDSTLKFVERRDDITLDDDPETLRAEMSCGHAVTPESLTAWCRSILNQGQCRLKCPAVDGTSAVKCDKLWPYEEVRRLALLTAEEMRHFEENMARLAAKEYCDFKTCPGCKTIVEREELTNLSVRCTVCTSVKRRIYEFCWQCLREWKGRAPRSDRCDNDGCCNGDLEILRKCKVITFKEVEGVSGCPSIRVCPTCGQRIEHNEKGCKNVICPRCRIEFCFVCLKLTPKCLRTGGYFKACSDGVAPRQTSIPAWRRI